MMITGLDFLKFETTNAKKRRHRKNLHFVFQHRRNIAITLSPEVEDRLGLVAGFDYCVQRVEDGKVILEFHRRGEPEA